MDSENNVIQFTPREGHPKQLTPKFKQGGFCSHEHITVDEHERLIECDRCGAVLDPFEYLWSSAVKENNQFATLSWLNIEVKRIQEEKENLLKEIAKLKAQRRRL